jgi:cytoskeletal protein RodZ
MDPIKKRELKRQAWMRLAAQRRRAGQLRGRVVAISLICFVVLWGVVFAQMATGNDPVLAGKEKASTTRAVASAKQEVETTDPRELEFERRTDAAPTEEEPEFEEEEFVEAEIEEEAVEAEPEIVEEEVEPLVTSQS